MHRPRPLASDLLTLGALTAALASHSAATAGSVVFATNPDTLTGDPAPACELQAGGITLTLSAAGNGDAVVSPATAKTETGTGVGVRSGASKWKAIEDGESLTLTFDRHVRLTQLDLGLVGGTSAHAATVTVGDGPAFSVYGKGKRTTVEPATEGVAFEGDEDRIDFAGEGIDLPAGTAVVLSKTGEKAFVLQGLTVEAVATLTDEPG